MTTIPTLTSRPQTEAMAGARQALSILLEVLSRGDGRQVERLAAAAEVATLDDVYPPYPPVLDRPLASPSIEASSPQAFTAALDRTREALAIAVAEAETVEESLRLARAGRELRLLGQPDEGGSR
jgi:hypothetical protein